MERVAVGLGVRDPHLAALCALKDTRAIDVLEVMIDDGLSGGHRADAWRRLGARWPLVAHGTELGVADAAGVDEVYVERVGRALGAFHVRWYSEHLAFLNGGGVSLGHFGPVGDDAESLAAVARNAAVVRARIACPLLLENPADVLGFGAGSPGAGAALGRAFAAALGAADAGALLDLTNLVLGARNDGYEPRAFLEEVPWDRVVEVHLAGGHLHDGLWIDSHAHDVDAEALSLLGDVAARSPNLRAVIIERDDRLPPLEHLLAEVDAARGVLRARGRR
jgi:uncharacterized protein (UPF0276 family)